MVKNQSGQAVTEYILLLSILAGMAVLANRLLAEKDFESKFAEGLSKDYARAYKYGDARATGYDEEEGPFRHPRALEGGSNFRIFFNPGM